MAIYGYARVCTQGQTFAAQEARLIEAGAIKVFSEKMSGASADGRKALARALALLNQGDVLIVTRLDRLARSTRDLLKVLDLHCGGRGRLPKPGRRLGGHDNAARAADARRPRRPCGV